MRTLSPSGVRQTIVIDAAVSNVSSGVNALTDTLLSVDVASVMAVGEDSIVRKSSFKLFNAGELTLRDLDLLRSLLLTLHSPHCSAGSRADSPE